MPCLPRLRTIVSALGLLAVSGCVTKATGDGVKPTPSAENQGIAFRDVAKEAGLDYVWKLTARPTGNILDMIGNGCGFLDFDNDGNLDILLVGTPPALYKGDGKGRFEKVPLPPLTGHFQGCATGDFNNDRFTDLYLTAHRGGALLQNNGGKGFIDVTKTSGVASMPWATAAAFGDLDADGNLDLYIGNYVKFGPETKPQLCQQKGITTACAPRQYSPEPGFLYKGNGKGQFRDITKAAGFDRLTGKALGVAIADYNDSGRLSVSVANDEMAGDLMKNLGNGKFENIAKLAGTATDNDGNYHGGMGTDWGDVDDDGRLDLLVATYQNEPKNIYHNQGDDLFTDKGDRLGLLGAVPYVTFGARFADFDNDGVPDIVLANGHVQDNIEKIDSRTTFLQPTVFYRGTKSGTATRFTEITESLDKSVTRPIMGRGLAAGDYDNDGRTDLLIVDNQGPPLLLHNETKGAGNFIGFSLKTVAGKTPLGATITVKIGDRTLVRHCHTDGSFMSASDPRVLVGLGPATGADSVTVRWPGGIEKSWRNLEANRYHTLE
ncbi:MAG: CRTAC1 family protein [Capsulimonadales bacterium]|nr:CRTAC1 family protein [Capsulimonadales bacterium]